MLFDSNSIASGMSSPPRVRGFLPTLSAQLAALETELRGSLRQSTTSGPAQPEREVQEMAAD
jgi:hypothetical protein